MSTHTYNYSTCSQFRGTAQTKIDAARMWELTVALRQKPQSPRSIIETSLDKMN